MAFFNEFPHTRTYDADLGWLIKHVGANIESLSELQTWAGVHKSEYKALADKVDGLINNLVDTIEPWDSSIAYHIFSIVSYQGQNYIAVQDVPIGAMITNTDYWQPANTVVEQINAIGATVSEVQQNIEPLTEAEPLNVLTLGVKNDGSEDCSEILNTYGAEFSLYFPVGVYLISEPVTFKHSVIGAVGTNDTGHCTLFNTTAPITLNPGEVLTIEFRNIMVDANNSPDAAVIATSERWGFVKISNCTIKKAKTGIVLDPVGSRSRFAAIENVRIFGPETDDTIIGSIGIDIQAGAVDSYLTDLEIMYCENGIRNRAGGLRIIGAHIFCGTSYISAGKKQTFYRGTICVNTYGTIYGNDIYLDTALQLFVQRAGASILGNIFCWNDAGNYDVASGDESIFTIRDNAKINISNLFVGGDGRNTNIIASDGVKVDNFIVMYDAASIADINNPANYRKYLTVNGLPNKSTFRSMNISGHTEITRIMGYSNGNCVVRIGTGSIYADVLIRYSSTGVISQIKYLDNPYGMTLYYKSEGPWTIIYSSLTSGLLLASAYLISASNNWNGPFAAEKYPNFTPDSKADTSELTLIPA